MIDQVAHTAGTRTSTTAAMAASKDRDTIVTRQANLRLGSTRSTQSKVKKPDGGKTRTPQANGIQVTSTRKETHPRKSFFSWVLYLYYVL